MGIVAKYREPRNAGELARLIETVMVCEFGMGCSGGSNAKGGDMDFSLDRGEVSVIVVSSHESALYKHHAGMIRDGEVLDWLDKEELALVENLRELRYHERQRSYMHEERAAAAAREAKRKAKAKPSTKAVVAAAFSAEDSRVGD